MEEKKVKDIMLPLEEYALVDEDASLYDAFVSLTQSKENLPSQRQPHRAVLVVDKEKNVIGKVGHARFLTALSPHCEMVSDFDSLNKSGVSKEYVTSMMDRLELWQLQKVDFIKKAKCIKITHVMHAFAEHIDEESSLIEAINKIITWNSLSMLVTRDEKVVGIIRMSDMFEEVSHLILGE